MRVVAPILLILFATPLSSMLAADPPMLVGHWKFTNAANDVGPLRLATTNIGTKFANNSAEFDGRGAHLVVKSHYSLRFGPDDFTLALWVNTPKQLDDDHGDLLTLYDARTRIGWNLSLRTNTGVTSSVANSRQLQFGIDAGTEPTWHDEGRPGNATLAFALTVHDGQLYAGTASNAAGEVGRVFRYEQAGRWIDCGAPDRANAISALAVFDGKLYAASSKYRFAGSSLSESPSTNLGGGIYRYEGDQRWTEVGRLPNTEAVGGLVVFQGRLYASSLYKPAGFFRYEGESRWTSLPVPDGKRVESMGVFNGSLWASSYDGGRVYRFDGQSWTDHGQLGDNTQTYSFAIHRGRLTVGTWPSGKVYAWNRDNTWDDLGRLGSELEVMGMLVHNGQLYAGTLPLAEVYRYEGGQAWRKLRQLDTTPNVKYRRVWTMAQHRGKLVCSTLPSGHVYSMTSGACVTHDRELPSGWQHVAAVKQHDHLKLYVNGVCVAESSPFDRTRLDVSKGLASDVPLLIGAGAGDFWHGSMRDVRVYRGALAESELRRLAKPW